MPAVTDENDPLVPKLPPSTTAKDLTYQGTAVDTQLQRIEQLYTHVPGSRWMPEAIYAQVLNTDDETRPLQPSSLEINQQYICILKMELKTTTAIPQTPDFNPESQEHTVKGAANVYPNSWIPNTNDHIVAVAPDGRRGLYQVVGKPVETSIFTKPGYTIEYILSRWLTPEDERNLKRRTVETYVYVRERVGSGINPLVTTDDYHTLEVLDAWHERIPDLYLTWFFNKEYATLTVPNQAEPTYDPFHAYFIQAIFESRISGVMTGLYHIPVMDGASHGYQTLWDLLLSMDSERLDALTVRVPVIATKGFIRNPYMHSVRYSGMAWVVYPPSPDRTDLSNRWYMDFEERQLTPGIAPPVKIRRTLRQLFPDGMLGTPFDAPAVSSDIKLVTYDDCYVLSEDFYARNTENLSKLEKVVWDALETGIVAVDDLLYLINQSERWSDVEKFYYIPILYALIPAAKRGV